MAGWFAGFRSSQSDSSGEPQPFDLVCECQVRHSGLRRKSHQRIICRSCGAALFVLPRNVYPAPSPPKPPKPRPVAEPDLAPPHSEGGGPPDSVGANPAKSSRVSRHKRRRQHPELETETPLSSVASQTSAAFASAADVVRRSTRNAARGVSDAGVRTAVGFWQFWTPLRITGLGIAVGLIAITLWTVHSRRLDQATQSLNPSIEKGLAAFSEGELSVARTELQSAVEALDTLDHHDRYSNSVRQASREATALDKLTGDPLLTLLEQADESVRKTLQSRPKPSPDDKRAVPPPPADADWVTRFEALYRGSWLVLEAPVQKVEAGPEEPRAYAAIIPLAIGPDQRPVEMRVDFECLDQLGVSATPRPVILGGQLESCRLSADETRWIVRLAPASGFLWVNPASYRRLGFLYSDWHREADVQQRLSEQAQAVGVDVLLDEPSVAAPELAPQG